ncbi:MAG: hypothetical protein AAF742_04500 [Pseudomonadota bacterium]
MAEKISKSDTSSGELMTSRDIAMFLIIGAVFWFAAAIVVRLVGPATFGGGLPHVFVYLACLPGGFISTWAIAKLARFPLDAMVGPMVIMLLIAMFLDGFALVWVPQLYGGAEVAAQGGAAILWGAACFLIAAIAFARFQIRA